MRQNNIILEKTVIKIKQESEFKFILIANDAKHWATHQFSLFIIFPISKFSINIFLKKYFLTLIISNKFQ